MKFKLIACLSLILTLTMLLLQAVHPSWKHHLQVDIAGQYMGHARHFLTDGNLSNIGYNEYQPGAVLFFVALSPILLLTESFEHFLGGLFVANILLLLLNAYLVRKIAGYTGVLVYSLILLFTGPIILYRFELLVNLFVLTSLYCWIRNRQGFSMFFLAAATFVKIYPALLLPYFMIVGFRQKKWSASLKIFTIFVGSLLLLCVVYSGLFRVSLQDMKDSLAIHSRKPVHVESVWATILTILPTFAGQPFASGQGNWGIFGISPENTLGPIGFYNYAWIAPLGLLYLTVLLLQKKGELDFRITLLIPLLFLIFSKILTPQYLLWFALLFPLLQPKDTYEWRDFVINLFLILLAAFLSQYVYPLQYDRLLGTFYQDGSESGIFWILATRNLALVILSLRFLRNILWHRP